jgi:hypothetical protein
MALAFGKVGKVKERSVVWFQFTHFAAKSCVAQTFTEVPNQIVKCFELQPILCITDVLPHTPPPLFWA